MAKPGVKTEERAKRDELLELSEFCFTVNGADLETAIDAINGDADKLAIQESGYEGTDQASCEAAALAYAKGALRAVADALGTEPA